MSLYGYKANANKLSTGISEVYMLFILFEKNQNHNKKIIINEIPNFIKSNLDNLITDNLIFL